MFVRRIFAGGFSKSFKGLQDVFFLMRYPFESLEAAELNKDIFETIYFAACSTSCALAEVHGAYETFVGNVK